MDDTNKEKAEEKPQSKVVKVPLKLEQACMDVPNITSDALKEAKKRLESFEKLEKEKMKREKAQHDLESFIFDNRDKLDIGDYDKVTTETERDTIREKLKVASDWMDETASPQTTAEEYESQLKILTDATKDLFYKLEEFKERPRAREALKQMLNYTRFFLYGVKNLTEDLQIFTETEISTLEKLVNNTQKWWDEKEEEQSKLSDHQKPAITMMGVAEKISALDREVKYLLNKARTTPPKKAPAKKADNLTEAEKAANETQEEKEMKPEEKTETAAPEGGGEKKEKQEGPRPPSATPPPEFEGVTPREEMSTEEGRKSEEERKKREDEL